MSNTGAIYALIDPTTGFIRYIGKGTNPKARYCAHIRDAKNPDKNSRKIAWIRSLLYKCEKPILYIIEEVNKAELNIREKLYIKVFRELGIPLTNMTEGGDGQSSGYQLKNRFKWNPKNPKHLQFLKEHVKLLHTPESKAKSALNRKGRKRKTGYEMPSLWKATYLYNPETSDILKFKSLKHAAKYLNTTPAAVKQSISGICQMVKGHYAAYSRSKFRNITKKRPKGLKRPVRLEKLDGSVIHFKSIREASLVLKLKRDTIYDYINTGKVCKKVEGYFYG